MIELINELPNLVQNEQTGNFEYPEEYQHKLFIIKSEYIYFDVNTYETYPKKLLDHLLEESTLINFSNTNSKGSIQLMNIDSLVEESFNNKFDQFKEDIDQYIISKLSKEIENLIKQQLQEFKDQLEQNNESNNSIPEFNFDTMKSDIKNQVLSELTPIITNKIDQLQKNITPSVSNKMDKAEIAKSLAEGLSFEQAIALQMMN